AELLERLAEDLPTRRPPHEAHLLDGPPLEPRPADQVRERVRGSPQQLLERRDDTEGLPSAGQAPARLPAAARRDAHRAVPSPPPLRDRGEGQPAALDGGAQLGSESLMLVRRHPRWSSSAASCPDHPPAKGHGSAFRT